MTDDSGGPESWDDPASSAMDEAASAAQGAPVGAGATSRFIEADVLGVGAGGRIVRGIDNQLGRDVALKIADPSRPDALRRLLREAHVLAALDHPGIVPLYDMAWRDDGGLQLALRIVRGETLGTLMRADSMAPLDLRLNALAAAATAMAYAHERGYVHRDIKPDNIMVGEQGETQVIDWGLATLGRRSANDATVGDGVLGDPALTHAGAVIGTPRYMSPEQARGEPVDARADVWALGAVLYEIVTGGPLLPQETSLEVLAALRDERVTAWISSGEASAGARWARVLRGALAPLDARLPNAAAFAHALRRARARRRAWPLVGVAATLAVVLAMAWPGPTAPPAGDTGDARRLAQMRATAAQQLWRDGSVAEAELMAAESLAIAPSPEALGVIAASHRGMRPAATVIAPRLPTCLEVDLRRDGQRWLCRTTDALAVYATDAPDGSAPLWRTPLRTQGAYFADDRVVAFVPDADGIDWLTPSTMTATYLDDAGRVVATKDYLVCFDAKTKSAQGAALLVLSGRRCVLLFDSAGGRSVPIFPLTQHLRVGVTGRQFAILDASGTLREGRVPDEPDTALSLNSRYIERDAARVSVVLPLGPNRAALATQDGELILIDEHDVVTRSLLGAKVAITAMVASPSGRVLVATRARGGPIMVDARSGRVVAYLPRHDAGPMVLVDDRHLITLTTRLVRWELPALDAGPSALHGYDDAIALATDGEHLAVSSGPHLAWIDALSGRELGRRSAPSFIKSVAISPVDGSVAFVGVDDTLATHFDPGSGGALPLSITLGVLHNAGFGSSLLTMARRVAFTPSNAVVVVPYEATASIARAPGERFLGFGDDEVIDLAIHGERVALLTAGRDVVLWDVGTAPVELARCPTDGAAAVALGPEHIIAAGARSVIALAPEDCTLHRLFPPPAPGASATKAAVSGDGRFVAVGARDGRVFVWSDDGELLVVLPAHDKLVSGLVFDPKTRFLAAAAWSGRVDLLDLEGLDALRALSSTAISDGVRAAYAL